jgi:hypothetical protein
VVVLDENPEDFDLSRVTTVREASEEFGVPENAVYQWIHREQIKSIGKLGRRKLFLHADIARAELKFRENAPDRGDELIAGWQRLKRAERAAARTAARNAA